MSSTERAISIWAVQDSLLQSYRSIFLTSISIFAALALSLKQSQEAIFLSYFVSIFGLYVNILWINLTWERGQSVFFLQTLIRRYETAEASGVDADDDEVPPANVFTMLRQFQDDSNYAAAEYKKPDFISPDPARSGLNFGLPCLFLVFWFTQTLYSAYRVLPDSDSASVFPTLGWVILTLTALWAALSFVALGLIQRKIDITLRFWSKIVISFLAVAAVYVFLYFFGIVDFASGVIN